MSLKWPSLRLSFPPRPPFRMETVDEIKDYQRYTCITFIDMLEALGRVADMKNIPLKNDLEAAGECKGAERGVSKGRRGESQRGGEGSLKVWIQGGITVVPDVIWNIQGFKILLLFFLLSIRI